MSDPAIATAPQRSPRWPIGVIALLAILHGAAAFWISHDKSATYDEPMHAVSGYLQFFAGDYRGGFDHPPMVHYLAGLAQIGAPPPPFDFSSILYRQLGSDAFNIWPLTTDALYGDPTHYDGVAFVARSRLPMVAIAMLGVLAVGLIARSVAGKRNGTVAGISAAVLMAADPNFLGHGSLVKNDVATACIFVVSAWWAWRMLERVSMRRAAMLGLWFGLGMLTKFSAMILIAAIAIGLVARALGGRPWTFGTKRAPRLLSTRWSRLGAVALIALISGLVTFIVIWAGYGFRYSAAANTLTAIDMQTLLNIYRDRAEKIDLPRSMRLIAWANEKRLMPEAFLDGLLYQQSTTLGRLGFIMGENHINGDWYYFPIAMLVKTPLGLVALLVLAAGTVFSLSGRWLWSIWRSSGQFGVANLAPRQASLSDEPLASLQFRRAILLFAVIAGFYLVTALLTPLNIGVRHVFPIYPFLFIFAGLTVARLWTQSTLRRTVAAFAVLAVVTESALATPNQLAFFNWPARLIEPDYWWLGDSNLDWGQDLPALARWQREHAEPGHPLYLGYFGVTNPSSYGIEYRNLPAGPTRDEPSSPNLGGYTFAPTSPTPDVTKDSAYLALSATWMQGQLLAGDPYHELRSRKPLAVLGRSIYVYKIGPWDRSGGKVFASPTTAQSPLSPSTQPASPVKPHP